MRCVSDLAILAIAIKALFIALGSMGVAALWEAVFADVGVALLAILNAGRLLNLQPGTST